MTARGVYCPGPVWSGGGGTPVLEPDWGTPSPLPSPPPGKGLKTRNLGTHLSLPLERTLDQRPGKGPGTRGHSIPLSPDEQTKNITYFKISDITLLRYYGRGAVMSTALSTIWWNKLLVASRTLNTVSSFLNILRKIFRQRLWFRRFVKFQAFTMQTYKCSPEAHTFDWTMDQPKQHESDTPKTWTDKGWTFYDPLAW